jgi:hypothetical protein
VCLLACFLIADKQLLDQKKDMASRNYLLMKGSGHHASASVGGSVNIRASGCLICVYVCMCACVASCFVSSGRLDDSLRGLMFEYYVVCV